MAAPTIGSVAPNSGPVAGGNSVVIGGTNLSGATSVTIGGANAAITANTATSVTVTAPSGTAGPAVAVVVNTPGGTATDSTGYTYLAAPTIGSVAPNSGPVAGGNSVVIGGTNLSGATSVTIGGANAAITADTATSVTVTAPSGTAGPAVAVVVNTPGGTATDSTGYTYVSAPTIGSVAPNSGGALGGDTVVIGGTNLANASSVTIGGAAAAITADAAASITVTTPAGAVGSADVVVTTPGGPVTDAGAFTYVAVAPAAPTVASVTAGDGSATVTWTPGPDGGSPITGYTATATPVLGPADLIVSGALSCTVPAPATSCTITGLVNGTTYTFTVTATNSVGPSGPSNPSTPVTPIGQRRHPGLLDGDVRRWGPDQRCGRQLRLAAGLALSKPIVALAPDAGPQGLLAGRVRRRRVLLR